jgi:hypothetical protein
MKFSRPRAVGGFGAYRFVRAFNASGDVLRNMEHSE